MCAKASKLLVLPRGKVRPGPTSDARHLRPARTPNLRQGPFLPRGKTPKAATKECVL